MRSCNVSSELEKPLSNKTVQEDRGFHHSLEDGEFVIWLRFFHRLIPHVDILHNQIQARQVDAVKVKNAVTDFIMQLIRFGMAQMPL
jgi:TPP-dependent 2-oxoacid decarboxylase